MKINKNLYFIQDIFVAINKYILFFNFAGIKS